MYICIIEKDNNLLYLQLLCMVYLYPRYTKVL